MRHSILTTLALGLVVLLALVVGPAAAKEKAASVTKSIDGKTVEEGTEVSVLAVDGMRLVVAPRGRS